MASVALELAILVLNTSTVNILLAKFLWDTHKQRGCEKVDLNMGDNDVFILFHGEAIFISPVKGVFMPVLEHEKLIIINDI